MSPREILMRKEDRLKEEEKKREKEKRKRHKRTIEGVINDFNLFMP